MKPGLPPISPPPAPCSPYETAVTERVRRASELVVANLLKGRHLDLYRRDARLAARDQKCREARAADGRVLPPAERGSRSGYVGMGAPIASG